MLRDRRRERQVLQGLVRGLSNKQIALEAEIAATTVRDYVAALCRKLGAANRTQVAASNTQPGGAGRGGAAAPAAGAGRGGAGGAAGRGG